MFKATNPVLSETTVFVAFDLIPLKKYFSDVTVSF